MASRWAASVCSCWPEWRSPFSASPFLTRRRKILPAELPPKQGNKGAEKNGDPPPRTDDKNDGKDPVKDQAKEPNDKKLKEDKPLKVELPPEVKSKEPEGPPELKVKVIETVRKTGKSKPRELRLVVSAPLYDDMGKLLDSLGKGYRHTQISDKSLEKVDLLKQFDVVFLTCKQSTPQNLRLNSALRQFVEEGGTLYASTYGLMPCAGAFPEYIEIAKGRDGDKQRVTANVVDPGLRKCWAKPSNSISIRGVGNRPRSSGAR